MSNIILKNIIVTTIIIIIIIIFCLDVFFVNIEHLTNDNKTSGKINSNNRTQELDELYKNSKIYDNIEGREGLDICLEECTGNCVEFGIHGKAFCFN